MHAEVHESLNDIDRSLRCDLSLKGAPECGGDIPSHGEPRASSTLHDRQESLDRTLDGGVDVLPVECLAGGREDGDLVDLRLQGPFEPLFVRNERRIDHILPPGDATQDLLRIAQLRHPARGNERTDLDFVHTRAGQGVHESDLRLCGHGGGLVLQAVPGPDFHDADHAFSRNPKDAPRAERKLSPSTSAIGQDVPQAGWQAVHSKWDAAKRKWVSFWSRASIL